MALFNTPLPGVANGNINVSVFIKPDPSIYCGYIQAGSGDKPIGISGEGMYSAPNLINALGGSSTTTYVATAGQEFLAYNEGDVCPLTAGTGGWTNGDFLKPDTNGNGITTTTVGDYYDARALSTVVAGALGQVQIMFGKL